MKNSFTKITFLLLLTFWGFQYGFGQKKLEKTVSEFQNATTNEGQMEAVKRLEKVSLDQPNNWQAAYWTAFGLSQVGRNSKNKLEYYDRAFEFLSKVENQLKQLTDEEKVYYYALESLISGLAQGPNFMRGNQAKAMKYVNQQKEAVSKGLQLDNKSPLLYVLLGTSLISTGERESDKVKILSGRLFLEAAREEYGNKSSKSITTPDRWNEPWIDFWLENSKSKV